jgi:hypothetical protein
MQSSFQDSYYSQEEWHIFTRAYHRACLLLGRDPQFHPLGERVMRSIMIFYERGEHDFGRLATMAVKRERQLPEDDNWSDANYLKLVLGVRPNRRQHLH